jgi:hypothetical protein
MERKWQNIVTDPNERKVLEALADPAWDFRTVDGLIRATALPESQVQAILAKYKSQNIIRQSPVTDRHGRPLFTLTSRGTPLTEYLNIIRSFVTKTTSG